MLMLLKALSGASITYLLYRNLTSVYNEPTSPLRQLPGPKSSHLHYGNYGQLAQSDAPTLRQEGVERYAHTLKYHHFFQLSRPYTMDTKALNHILTNNNVYQRQPHWCYLLSLIVGPGIFTTEEDVKPADVVAPGFNYTFNSLNAERPA